MDKYAETREFEICPYNSSHRVEKGTRFQAHLVACAQNYPDTETVHCPFNYTHLVRKPEIRYHLLYCPDSDEVKKKMVNMPNIKKFVPPVEPVTTEPLMTGGRGAVENWDNEVVVNLPPANPSLSSYNSNQIINTDSLSGLKKAQKKKIRENIARGRNPFHDAEDDRSVYSPPPQQQQQQQQQQQKQPQQPQQPQKTVLKEIPQPKEQPMTTKIGSQALPNRIAANIFPGGPQNSSIGFGVNPPPGIRPPPGLMSQQGGFNRPPYYPMSFLPPEMATGARMHNFGRGMINYQAQSENSDYNYNLSQSMMSRLSTMSMRDDGSEVRSEAERGRELEFESEFEDKQDEEFENRFLKKGEGNVAENADVESEGSQEWMEQVFKRKRRLEKKLRQIENLELKLKNGEVLNSEEMSKIAKKRELVAANAATK